VVMVMALGKHSFHETAKLQARSSPGKLGFGVDASGGTFPST